jgi:hypothetical protein
MPPVNHTDTVYNQYQMIREYILLRYSDFIGERRLYENR